MANKIVAELKGRWTALCGRVDGSERRRQREDRAEAARRRDLSQAYYPGFSPEGLLAADALVQLDAALAGVPFANTPVWQGKACTLPRAASRQAGGMGIALPDELWLRVAEYVAQEQQDELQVDLLNLRASSRYFSYVADFFAPELFYRQVLSQRIDRRLGALPQACTASLFGRLLHFELQLVSPRSRQLLVELLPEMKVLQKLSLSGLEQNFAEELALPQTLRALDVSSFRLHDFNGWAAGLPENLQSLSLRFGTLGQTAPSAWPVRVQNLTLQHCHLDDSILLDFAPLQNLRTLNVAHNQLHTGNNLRLAPRLERLVVADNALTTLNFVVEAEVPHLRAIDARRTATGAAALQRTPWIARCLEAGEQTALRPAPAA